MWVVLLPPSLLLPFLPHLQKCCGGPPRLFSVLMDVLLLRSVVLLSPPLLWVVVPFPLLVGNELFLYLIKIMLS